MQNLGVPATSLSPLCAKTKVTHLLPIGAGLSGPGPQGLQAHRPLGGPRCLHIERRSKSGNELRFVVTHTMEHHYMILQI